MITVKETEFLQETQRLVNGHGDCRVNVDRQELIRGALVDREAMPSANGALATWTPKESTGRSPKDTYIVRRPESERDVDWDSPHCIEMAPETFEMLWHDTVKVLGGKDKLYVLDRVAGADPAYALPIRTITDRAVHTLFADNMFRPVPDDIERSIFAERGFTLLVAPYDKLDRDKYKGKLRDMPDGKASDMAIAMDFDLRLGVVYGSAYCGSIKKLIFTVMNFLLPGSGILPLHCAANEARDGSIALLLGLSGTGKTSLSADPNRALLGDDEHGWSDDGVANFEGGCYAKLINLRVDKETEIFNAVFHESDPLEHGAIIENCMMYPDGHFDVDDERLTPNSRGSYPLNFLANIKTPPMGGHPTTILFLTADANGVLPPVAKLTPDQAMLWFLMGYTSKLAGTETGVTEPVSTFSRFFGAPFMARNPDSYATMLGAKLAEHGTRVYLINTGWSGGAYGEGKRMDISLTRAVVDAALDGKLDDVECHEDPLFHVNIPKHCPGVPDDVLVPRNTWRDKQAYDERAKKLANEFTTKFDKIYGNKGLDESVVKQCPGK